MSRLSSVPMLLRTIAMLVVGCLYVTGQLPSKEYIRLGGRVVAVEYPTLTITSVSPNAGVGSNQTFSIVFTDTKGYADIQWVELLLATAPDGGGNTYCLVHYDAQGNAFYVYGDGGSFSLPASPGTWSNQLQNSFCALNAMTSFRSASGNTLTIGVSLVFKASGARNTYLRIHDLGGQDTGMQLAGTWTASASSAPNMLVSPSSGTLTPPAQQAFTLTYPDPAGFTGAPYGWKQFVIAVASDGGGQPYCYVHYDRAGNALWMYSGDVGSFLGPVTPGASSTTLTSTACSVNTASATVQNTGGNLVLTLPITLKPPMAGSQKLFERSMDVLNVDTGFVQTGTFTINSIPPYANLHFSSSPSHSDGYVHLLDGWTLWIDSNIFNASFKFCWKHRFQHSSDPMAPWDEDWCSTTTSGTTDANGNWPPTGGSFPNDQYFVGDWQEFAQFSNPVITSSTVSFTIVSQ